MSADKFQNKYRIPSARHPNWDYGSNGVYFITICTKNRQYFLGECNKGEMKLSTAGAIAQGFWYEIPKHFPFITLGEFIVMPNHVHGILILDKNLVEKNIDKISNIYVETGTRRPRNALSLPRTMQRGRINPKHISVLEIKVKIPFHQLLVHTNQFVRNTFAK